jgi:mRNA-degrading endonuclease RelE of RelBE toxin-antitoxin system
MVGFGRKLRKFYRNKKSMLESRQPESIKIVDYVGPSMNPLLKSGDRLQIAFCDQEKIRVGDVVVFYSPRDETKVVHRVTSINSHGIKTRGDNCINEDDWVLRREHIVGRVVSLQRGDMHRRIFGGPLGRLFAVSVRVIRAMDSGTCYLIRPAYNELAKLDIFIRLLPSQMRPRVISPNRAAGKELQLLMGTRVIGRWLPGRTRWQIKRPFRLLVDEEALPVNPASGSEVRCPLSFANKAKVSGVRTYKDK